MVNSDIAKGDLIALFSEYTITTHPLYLLYLRNEYASEKHKVVKEFILDWFARNPELFAGSDGT